ncbi:MAG: hypothetical protein JWP91_2116 [Fibrobacteres bacterium]|nr:hypothetical protein [Fibrobacterota bacterium]
MSDIYSYSDYRQFLKDHYERNKAVHPGFSYRFLAEKAGINSAPYFKFVIEGKRNLSKKTILKTCIALKLKDKEAEYFEHLVFFNQAKSAEEKSIYFDKLISLQRYRNIPRIKADQMEYFQEWHHCVIRELAAMTDFGGDYARLGKLLNPPIPAAKAEASLKLLLELGFLKKEKGGYVQVDPVMTTGPGVQDFQVIRHQIRMMQLAIESFERCRAEERMISSSTMGVSRGTFERVVKKVRDFRAHLAEMVSQDEGPERVYQLTISMIPLSQKPGAKP